MKIRPRSEVPVVRITAGAGMKPWFVVLTPVILVDASSVSKPITRSSRTTRLSCENMTVCMRLAYSFLSHCARVARTAGPRLRFNVFSWSEVRSALNPISPPKASSSKTRWLFASPPIDGLHGMRAIASARPVTSRVGVPIRAATRAASAPACPPPTTMICGLKSMAGSIPKTVVRHLIACNILAV